jgi:CHAT domain-containing protein/Tfp pilus assembly protein PilF
MLFIALLASLASAGEVPLRLPRAQTAAQQEFDSAVTLSPTTPIEREIGPGQQHTFRVDLEVGQAARLLVDQRGVDVAISVQTADGKPTIEFDDDSRPDGVEQIGLLAEGASGVLVTIRPAFLRSPKTGRFVIRLEDVHRATQADRARFEAHRVLDETAREQTAAHYDNALTLATRALELAEQSPPLDTFAANVLMRLGDLRSNRSNRLGAEEALQRAVKVDEAAVGRQHPQTATALVRLASFYATADDFSRAEPLMSEGLAIAERTLGRDHPRLVALFLSASAMYIAREDYDRALAVLERALAIADTTLDPNSFTVLAIANNIGDILLSLKQFDRAETFFRRSLEGIERLNGPDHPRMVNPLVALAIVMRERKEFDRALESLWRAESIRERTLGGRHPQTAAVLITIGNVYRASGDYQKAIDTFQRALPLVEAGAGPYHSLTMLTLGNLARTYAAAGDIPRALAYQTRADRVLETNVDLNVSIGSERSKLAYLTSTAERTSRTISLHLHEARNDQSAADLAALVVLQRKGRVFDALSGSLAAVRQRLDPDDQQLLEQLGETTSQLASLALNGPRGSSPEDYRAKLTALEQDHEQLEARISSRSAQFRAQSQPVTLPGVKAAIPPGAALVELVVYQPFFPTAQVDADAWGDPQYAAYVLRPNQDAHWVELGAVRDIDAAAAALRAALRDPTRTDIAQLARAADVKILEPIRPLVGDATRLLIAPDGELNLLPFETLIDVAGRYAVERYAISYLTSGRDLLRMQVPRISRSEPVVIADPSFGEPENPNARPTHPASVRARSLGSPSGDDISRVYFAPLAATAGEARAIKALFPDARILSRQQATKSALVRLDSPRLLHVATHGFFLGEPADGASPADGRTDNPLLRSGLALAHANLATKDNDAGILTALEASTLNLWGTKLVTLSACDTGVGAIRTGEGVYGLRRAFFLAGAETLVMSLWPVSDAVTREVMTAYYGGLKEGLGRGDALRRAQLAMLARKSRQHPFYWASFIQAGEWANLDGRR